MRRILAMCIAVTVLAPGDSGAQITVGQGNTDYRALYGEPVPVSLDDLIQDAEGYRDRAVRTRGRLDFSSSVGLRAYVLRSTFGVQVQLAPVSEISGAFADEAPRILGENIEVTGVVHARNSSEGTLVVLEFWSFVSDEKEDPAKPISAKTVTLEDLVSRPGRLDGRTVRVVGKFRGRNLYGDLPAKSGDSGSDWVIKDDVFAAWVTGRRPKGSGFALDPSLKRDTGKWLAVVGQVETRGAVVYLRARSVTLSEPPRPAAEALPPPPPKERPKVPPSLVFSLPLDGESDVARDTRFVVQFSKDMDEASFGGRIGLRYSGPRRAGDRDFDGLAMSYDGGLRALTVDPGDLLRPGRDLELVLLGGILDIDGLELVPRAGAPHDGVVDVLRYRVSPY